MGARGIQRRRRHLARARCDPRGPRVLCRVEARLGRLRSRRVSRKWIDRRMGLPSLQWLRVGGGGGALFPVRAQPRMTALLQAARMGGAVLGRIEVGVRQTRLESAALLRHRQLLRRRHACGVRSLVTPLPLLVHSTSNAIPTPLSPATAPCARKHQQQPSSSDVGVVSLFLSVFSFISIDCVASNLLLTFPLQNHRD